MPNLPAQVKKEDGPEMAKHSTDRFTLWKSFKEFVARGSVLDLAVGVIIGAAFGKIVSSLVDDILMPIIGLLLGGINFTSLEFRVGEAVIRYGTFMQSIMDFSIIAFSLFIVIRALIRIKIKKEEEPAESVEYIASNEEKLLSEIRDLLKER